MYTIDNAPAYVLRAYANYINDKEKLKQKPLPLKKWQQQEPQPQETPVTPSEGKTIAEFNKEKLIEIFVALLEHFEEDITNGIEDGTYELIDNIGNLATIKEAQQIIAWFKGYQPYVCITISDENAHPGVHASESIEVDVYDSYYDDNSTEAEPYEWTEEEWTEKLEAGEAKKELISVF